MHNILNDRMLALCRHDNMNQQILAHNPIISMKQRKALEAVMDAANLQELDGTLWMHSSLLTDPASLCNLAKLISAWAYAYDADIPCDSQGALETDYSSIRYHHSHDETL